ncbi:MULTISPECIES: hypothetical protein [Bacillales]|uniref:Uncharacterized protein n=3 Tax=Bacillales TaxID=1385 RepID=G3GCB2_9BACL|nr:MULTISPECIES: hypothetical protein [Bacillales]AEM62957.1 hypothetical protein [Bhargavaea cecembensis]HJF32915.1 hypothetical protein [Sporosarcina psychrophila]HJG32344.1 hypothetical protein [Jeotgalicoccus aerolatus]MCQ9888286.1 hypothetical protein [Staphylococcus aureus]MCQ9897649.1 hypothetical protein [Staphylococcus aureus]
MIVNHASILSVDYFISYLELIMKARQLSLEEAVFYMKENFFKGEAFLYGEVTAKHFEQAIQLLKRGNFK